LAAYHASGSFFFFSGEKEKMRTLKRHKMGSTNFILQMKKKLTHIEEPLMKVNLVVA
jgi:hypothetical protein